MGDVGGGGEWWLKGVAHRNVQAIDGNVTGMLARSSQLHGPARFLRLWELAF